MLQFRSLRVNSRLINEKMDRAEHDRLCLSPFRNARIHHSVHWPGYREDTRGWVDPSAFIQAHCGAADDDVGRTLAR